MPKLKQKKTKGPWVPDMQQFPKRMQSEVDERRKETPSLTPKIATNIINIAKKMSTEEMFSFLEVFNGEWSSTNEKQKKDNGKVVGKLKDRLGLSENSSSNNNDIDSTVQNQPKQQLPKAMMISNSKTSTTTHKKNNVAKSKNIKFDAFSSQEDIDSCFLKCLSMGTKTKTGMIVAIENLVINAANAIFREQFKKKDFMWHRETLGDQVENFLNIQFEKEAEKLGDDIKGLAEDIRLVHPDGFFCMQGYDRPIMICNYKAPEELTEEDCKWFDKYSKACQDANIPAAEMFYRNSKLPEYENDPNLIKFEKLFQDVYSNTTKYGAECASVSSERCWLFLHTPQDALGTAQYKSIFVHDNESWKKAFDELLDILLTFSTQILKKKKPYEFGRFDERYESFKNTIMSKTPKGTERKNKNGDKNGSNNDNDDKDDEDKNNKNTLKQNLTSVQSSRKNQPSGSDGVSKEIREQKDDSEQEIEIFGPNNKTDKPTTNSVELLNNCHPPLAKCCTQKCLLGLKKNNLPMNKKCPNYSIHKKNSHTNKNLHPITYDDLATIFHNQIKNSTDRIQSFDSKYGPLGYMTKVTVYPYGYTIVGKGNPFIHGNDGGDMKQESSVSKGLGDDLQGELSPLSLGFTDVGYYCYFPVSYEGEKKNPESSKDFNDESV